MNEIVKKKSLLVDIRKKEELIALLEKQRGFYQVILEMATNVRDLLMKKQPMKEVLNLINKKKILLSCVKDVETKLFKKMKIEQLESGIASPHSPEEVVKEIMKVEEENQKLMLSYMQRLEKNIGELERTEEEQS